MPKLNSALDRLATAWRYRGFIVDSVRRDFSARYQNSLLGATWSVISPLAMIFTYTVIFAQLMRSKLPGVEHTFAYSLYICSGLITWGLFSETVLRSQNVFLENANLLKKLNFPRLCLPIIVVLNAWLNFLIIFSLFLLFTLFTHSFPGWMLLAIIPLLLLQTLFAASLGVIIGILNVFFRDVGQLLGVTLQFWFWFTPIVYPISILPHWAAQLIALNPLAALMNGYQNIFVFQTWPDWPALGLLMAYSVAATLAAIALYRRRAGEMVDEL
jgi:lipopolysaccharide transport system permease protein